MSGNRKFVLVAGLGCAGLLILTLIALPLAFFLPLRTASVPSFNTPTAVPGARATQEVVPTLTPVVAVEAAPDSKAHAPPAGAELIALYKRLNPGVVSIQVNVERGGVTGQGAGSGFLLNPEGHIVTNNHVVAGAGSVLVTFHEGTQTSAEIIGLDDDSDLAVVRVDHIPPEATPLPLGNSDRVEAGEWVIAIGNPFALSSSMSIGIVSAVGRTIPSGATQFSIPEAIQTDAAINPGNSGGPLLNLSGEVIGVNAQIASGGSPANAGVGFAIPVNVVRRVAPVLMENGFYQWPWLGIRGRSVGLLLMEANDLDTQHGAYVGEVISGGPADQAGLRGSTGAVQIDGVRVSTGGDVIVAADGRNVEVYADLLVAIADADPEDELALTILRDGRRQKLTVQLAPRPE